MDDFDGPHEGMNHVGKRLAEKAEDELEKLLSEELDDAFTLRDFANNHADLEENERARITAGIETTAAYLPDSAEPAAKPAMCLARQDAGLGYDVLADFTNHTRTIANALAQRATSTFCRVS